MGVTRIAGLLALAVTTTLLAGCDAVQKEGRRESVGKTMDDWADNSARGGQFAEFRRDFPNDFGDLKAKISSEYSKTGEFESLGNPVDFVQTFITAHWADESRAPTDDLVALFKAEHAVITEVDKAGIDGCANGVGKLSNADLHTPKVLRDLGDNVTTLEIKAIRGGIDHSTVHPPFVLSEFEWNRFVRLAAARGVAVTRSMTTEASCRAGPALQEVVAGLSDDRIAAFESNEIVQDAAHAHSSPAG